MAAEKVWTFKGSNYGGMEGYAESTMTKTDDRDTPHYIMPCRDVPTNVELGVLIAEHAKLHQGEVCSIVDKVRYVLNHLGLKEETR